MIHASSTLVIVGSLRSQRLGAHIAKWVAEVGRLVSAHPVEVVDLRDWPLPMDDEPDIPAAGQGYRCEHTRAWSLKVAAADAIVLVTPQYNWGYPAALKNALDHLYAEWAGKPVLIVSYGGHGGNRCAEQLQQVCQALHMRPVTAQPGLRLARERIEANRGEIDAAQEFATHLEEVRQGFAELADMRASA